MALVLLPERDCSRCNAARKKEWGCNAVKVKDGNAERWEGAAPLPIVLDGAEQYQCPRRPVVDEPMLFHTVLRTVKLMDKGLLPYPGSVSEQPYKLMALSEVASDTIAECKAAKAAEDRRKAPKGPPVNKRS